MSYHSRQKSIFDSEIVFFPVIGKNVTLHRQPCGILAKVPSHGSPQPKVYELNNFASELLFLCTGRNSIQSIFSEIKNMYYSEKFDVSESVRTFFLDAFSKGILELHDEPVERQLKVSGSSEYYSPSHFSVEVTDACNLNCKHCYRDSGSGRKNRLPTRKLLEILKEMSEHGVLSVELTGGEPTFHPDIREIVKYCCEDFTVIAILSNGWFIDEEFGKFLSLFKNKLFVQVDLDGHIPAVHDALRGVNGSFSRALRAIRTLVKHHVRVRVAMNVYPGNYRYVKQTFLLAKELGANWFGLAPLMPVGRGKHITQLGKDQVEAIVSLAEEFSEHYPDFFFVSTEMEKRIKGEIDNCGAGSRSMVLGPNGLVRPCLILGESYFSFGNLTKMSYLDFLQTQTPLISYFYHLKAPNHITCQECSFYASCVGCFAGQVAIMEKTHREGMEFQCRWEKINNFLSKINLATTTYNNGGKD
jgi:radical SAM protein with 4Fe4S-binding SPASM domain